MTDTLIIIPTKDRIEYLNCLIQNLIIQEGEFDVFIADMCTDPNLLHNNHLLCCGLERLGHLEHSFCVQPVTGTNQCDSYNAGLAHAIKHGYKYCMGGDDDIIYEPGWMNKGIKHMKDESDLGVCAGITLIPVYSLASQTVGQGVDPEIEKSPGFDGTLANGRYEHFVYVPTYKTPIYCEHVYGGWFFRPVDAAKVRGFPTYLSPLGFRGEGFVQTAIFFLGKRMMVDPTMISWHYQSPCGGLRFDHMTRAELVKKDDIYWEKFIQRRLPRTDFP